MNTCYLFLMKKKSVKKDFIKNFRKKTKQEKISIGLHFNYLNVQEPQMQILIKQNEQFQISHEMNLDEFKQSLNNLTNSIHTQNINEIVEVFNEKCFKVSKTNRLKMKK